MLEEYICPLPVETEEYKNRVKGALDPATNVLGERTVEFGLHFFLSVVDSAQRPREEKLTFTS